MSDRSEDKNKPETQNSSTPEAKSSDASVESVWLDVEAELERPIASPTEPPQYSESQSSLAFSRTFDPTSPLMMVETAFLASAASLIWLVNYYFPVGPLLRIFFPIPIALIYLRWNSRAAWMGALVSGLLLSVLMGPVRSLLFVMPYGLLGVLLGLFWRRGAKWEPAIAISSLLGSFGFFFRIWLVSILLGDDLWLYATTQVTEFLEWLFIRLGLLIQPSLWLIQVMIVIMVLLSNVLYLFVVHLVALFLLDRLRNPIPRPPRWVQILIEYE